MFATINKIFKTINDCADAGLAAAEAEKVRAEIELEQAKLASRAVAKREEEQRKALNALMDELDAELIEAGINIDGLKVVK